jgi:hypothetical protein
MLYKLYVPNITWIVSLQLTLIFLFCVLSFKKAASFFDRIPKSVWLTLLGILIIETILFFTFKRSFIGAADEWESLMSAKYLINGNVDMFMRSLRHATTWPVLLSILFRVFGQSPEVVTYLNLFIQLFCSVSVFLIVYLLYKKETPALLASLLFSFSNTVLVYSLILKGKPFFVCGLVCLLLLVSILSFRLNDWKMFSAAALCTALFINARPEMVVYLLPLAVGFLLLSKKLSPKKLIVPFLLFAIFGSIFYLNFHRVLEVHVFYTEAIGDVSGRKLQSQRFFENLFPTLQLADVVKIKLGEILRNPLVLFKIWFRDTFPIFLLTFLFPLVYMSKKDWKPTVFLLLSFLVANIPYVNHEGVPETRFVIHIFPMFFCLNGYGVYLMLERIKSLSARKAATNAAFLAFFLLGLFGFLSERRRLSVFVSVNAYEYILDADKIISEKYDSPYVIVKDLDRKCQWMFLTKNQIINMQNLAPGIRHALAYGDIAYSDYKLYGAPMEFLSDAPRILERVAFTDETIEFKNQSLLSQCKHKTLISHEPIQYFELTKCKPRKSIKGLPKMPTEKDIQYEKDFNLYRFSRSRK